MSFSHNEVMGLATKAARGAGAGPAQAQSFGRMVVCHLGAGRDPQALIEALEHMPEGAIIQGPLLCRAVLQAADEAPTPMGEITSAFDIDAALIQSYLDTLNRPSLPERLTMPTPLLTRFNRLAKLTYVPNSDASRGGAGAGLTDND